MSNKISIMAKRLKLATRALGAEPEKPDVVALAAWIAEHRGRMADITTYLLDRSMAPQIPAGIGIPCAGGRFYADRLLASIDGVVDRKAICDLHADTPAIIEDAAGIVVQKRKSWCALPAPHVLSIKDAYYSDADEWSDAICGIYKTILRAMRDMGIAGHVLICDAMDGAECAALARQNVFFFQPMADQASFEIVLEHQQKVAVGNDELPILIELMNEYTVRHIILVDPDQQAIDLARSHLDPDQITAGGYCTDGCEQYWNDLVAHAECER